MRTSTGLDKSRKTTHAKQHLFEFAAFHERVSLCVGLRGRPAYRPARPREATAAHARERALEPYLKGDPKQALDDAGRYRLDHRNMMGMTPLMMAAHVGQLELARALVERGRASTPSTPADVPSAAAAGAG